jgi:hypothetical protein
MALQQVQWFDHDGGKTVISRSLSQAEASRGSAGIQLVGYAEREYTYGVFSGSKSDWGMQAVTVIAEGGTYYAIRGWPERFLRSLLDPGKYPHLATEALERIPLKASTDKEAVEEARALMKQTQSS